MPLSTVAFYYRMDDNLKIIYRILKKLRDSLPLEEFDPMAISAKELNIPEPQWARIMAMLVTDGYVSGIKVSNTFDQTYPKIYFTNPSITIKGLEYLEDNSLMKRIANTAKGIKEIVS